MTITKKHSIFKFLIISAIILLFAFMFWPFFTPLLFAVLFAFALENVTINLTKHFKKKSWATMFTLLFLFLIVATPLTIIILKVVSTIKEFNSIGFQNTQLYQMTQKLIIQISENLSALATRFEIDTTKFPQLEEVLSQSSSAIASGATTLISKLPQLTLSFFVFLLGLYFFLTQSSKIKIFFTKLDLLSVEELSALTKIIQTSSYLTLVASVLIGSIQSLIIASFGYFAGFNEFLLLFVMTFLFSLIPIIGAAPVGIFLALLALAQTHTSGAIIMIIAATIAGSLDNLIKPMIVNANSDNLHPIIALLALIGGIFIYGPAGILLGPILTQLVFKLEHVFFTPKITNDIENTENIPN